MSLHAELALVKRGGISSDELPETRTDRALIVHQRMRERGKLMRCLWIERQQMPYLPVVRASGLGVLYQVAVDTGFGVIFNPSKENRFLRNMQCAHVFSS